MSPRNPLNIGAAARAMANFGFRRLSVVAPYEEHWREAKSAVGAEALLQNAKRVERVAEAVADCTLVLGSGTSAHRKLEQPVVSLPELAPLVEREMKCGGRVALVFGTEKRGLTREDLSYCHWLVEIPTDPRQPSLNLGQAVAVCLYELAAHMEPHPSDKNKSVARVGHPAKDASGVSHLSSSFGLAEVGHPGSVGDNAAPATARDLELLAGVVEETMTSANYSPAVMRRANRHDLQLFLRRLVLSHRDARRILGLFRRILWKFKEGEGASRTHTCI